MITKTTTSSSNGYINLHRVGRCVVTLNTSTGIGIECVAKGANHYYHIEGISAKNARDLARQLVMAADEMDQMDKIKEAPKK